ncbi:MAG TPA: sigma-70 family RNA polymerase sigma factor [Candidatus Krumholzibacteria bacterium]|nr:sigma-70 family RNA polymerase sigma factor [Candidatus Krumholzibacteria bacterium]HPD73316.1 sigma-70 family RNA polymerase sigma factor [Candidatus Krumholzibacteria bacterium]HRY42032.1 sigma-70 family RNA polymerase sigma factor [Candidatus Krumholzibacteria bacterium]
MLEEEAGFATCLIRKMAHRMIGTAGFIEADRHDLQQDLWLDLLERFPKYRPDRGHVRAFIARVVKNKAASILAARRAAKRNGDLRMRSLDEEFDDEDGEPTERHETISVDDYLRRTRGITRSQSERQDLAIDIRRVIASLQPHEQVVCLLLIDRDVCDVANVIGLPRSTLRDLIRRLRQAQEVASYEKYLE